MAGPSSQEEVEAEDDEDDPRRPKLRRQSSELGGAIRKQGWLVVKHLYTRTRNLKVGRRCLPCVCPGAGEAWVLILGVDMWPWMRGALHCR